MCGVIKPEPKTQEELAVEKADRRIRRNEKRRTARREGLYAAVKLIFGRALPFETEALLQAIEAADSGQLQSIKRGAEKFAREGVTF